MTVIVKRIELRDDDRIAAICVRGRAKQVVDPTTWRSSRFHHPARNGVEWIDAYRAWWARIIQSEE